MVQIRLTPGFLVEGSGLLFMEFHLDYENQLKKFIERGMIIKNYNDALRILNHVSYYKIKEFSAFFMNSDGTYKPNTYFEAVVKNFYFDKNLRLALLKCTEKIELSIKNKIAYQLGAKYGWRGYLNFSSWCDRINNSRNYIEEQENDFKKKLKKKIKKYKQSNYIIKEFYKLYPNEEFPSIWRISEILTFGEILYIFQLMSKKNKEAIVKKYSMKIDEFESYTKHINLIRNLCAHNMPIIDINIKTPPKIPSEVKYLVNNPRKLITSILIIIHFVKIINPNYSFLELYNVIIKKLIKNDYVAKKYGITDIKLLKQYFKK